MKISVITPTLNSIQTIHRTYASIKKEQQYIQEWIVVDSGSIDGTVEFLKKCKPSAFPVSILSSSPRGPYDAMNVGIKVTSGEVISILNSDDAWTDGVAREVLNEFSDSSVDIVYGRIKYIDHDDNYSLVGDSSFDNVNKFRLNLVHPAVFIARQCYEKIGYFNMRYPVENTLHHPFNF